MRVGNSAVGVSTTRVRGHHGLQQGGLRLEDCRGLAGGLAVQAKARQALAQMPGAAWSRKHILHRLRHEVGVLDHRRVLFPQELVPPEVQEVAGRLGSREVREGRDEQAGARQLLR